MSEFESTPPTAPEPAAAPGSPQPTVKRPRLRRFFLRHLPVSVAALLILLAATLGGLYYWASSAEFENLVRREIVAQLETVTGGRVEIGSFHWRLLRLEAEADGLVIHGSEAPGEAPYAQVESLSVRLNVLGFLSPRIQLRSLKVVSPQLHLIVYPDGSTNQPQPRKPNKTNKSALDSLFDLQAGYLVLQQGTLDYDNRAAAFDFQNRFIPLDFTASDVSLRMVYFPASAASPESYRIEAGASDLNLARGAKSDDFKPRQSGKTPPPVHGFFQATLDLTRSAATLRSLRITARNRGLEDRTLSISGSMDNFARPRWQAKAFGELDLRLLDPITGYPFAPQGIAHLDLAGAGQVGTFRADGSIHVDGGAYIGTGVVATGVRLDARVHADPEQLLITSIVARLRQGGQIEGNVALAHWLPVLPGAATLRPASPSAGKSHGARSQPVLPAKPLPLPGAITIPVNGKVTANFKNVALDTILEMVSQPPFQHLGFDTRVNGVATALWIKGDQNTLAVDAQLALNPPAQTARGMVPASGQIDATYTQRDGAVTLRKFEMNLPASRITATGHLGAYPLSSPTALAADLHTSNLGEFDTVLRDLGLSVGNCGVSGGKSPSSTCRTGVAALPIALSGQADFHGSWSGSLLDPHLSGTVKATQLTAEIPAISSANSTQKPPALPQFLHLDAVEAVGSYSSAKIAIDRGVMRHGNAEIAFNGSLVAAPGSASYRKAPVPSFDANSALDLRLHAAQVSIGDLQPLISQKMPLTGALSAQLQISGLLRALNGAGWLELNKGSVFGEPVDRIRVEGRLAGQTINLTAITASLDAGRLGATGSYDLGSHRFQVAASGAAIDIARLEVLRNHNLAVAGKMGFTLSGAGTLDDPRLEAHATLTNLALGGESLGGLQLVAHAAGRDVTYDLTTRLEGAQLTAHGQTELRGDYQTQAQLNFSHFDIDSLIKLAHVQGLSGDSSLAGTVTVNGPLARPSALRGEARLQELAVTVAGVPLRSVGGVHATLANSRINLDPLHVTGEETDLRAQGSLSLEDKRQLDFAASGSINLKLAESLDPDLTARGASTFKMEAHGPLANPGLTGRIDFQNCSLSLEDIPNGLSQLHGTLEFNQNRLEVKSLTAMTGGGLLSVAGYLAYQHGLYADLTATGKGIRIRYPQGVSSLADATLHLQGTQNSLLLGGNVLITRFTMSPDLDIAALAAQANVAQPIAPPNAPSNHIRLDVHVVSSPQLNFQNAYAKLAGNVDLHLRGTVASPSLLGRVSITEGSANIAGTRYELQRGNISFTNPVRIEPIIDLSATARVQDYDITLGLHGTPDKLAVTYRSDPPMAEADLVALLALGRTESQQRLYTQQQQQSGSSPTTDVLLGGALNATVSSRVQRLFGAGSVKVDPNYLGALGNSTTRIIAEEQVGRTLTLTYATNVNTTSQQLIQAEIAINRHVSLVVARDESGVFSVVLKATRRYR